MNVYVVTFVSTGTIYGVFKEWSTVVKTIANDPLYFAEHEIRVSKEVVI